MLNLIKAVNGTYFTDASTLLAVKSAAAPMSASAPDITDTDIHDSALDLTDTKVDEDEVNVHEEEGEDTIVSPTAKPESVDEQMGPENEMKPEHTTYTAIELEVQPEETDEEKPITDDEHLVSLTDKELEEEKIMQVATAARNRALSYVRSSTVLRVDLVSSIQSTVG